MTVACVHQPNYLPWLGFFAKIAASDAYLVMDNVQFPRNSWVNRVRVGGNGPPVWLTVPIRHATRLDIRIDEVEIAWDSDWPRKHLATLQQRYARSPWLREVLEPIEAVLARRYPLLAEQNLALIEAILGLCSIERTVVRGSRLQAGGAASELIAAMCAEIGASGYLAGQGAADYDELSAYDARGIAYRKASFTHPEYPQRGAGTFVPGLSIVDALFNVGPERTREMLAAPK